MTLGSLWASVIDLERIDDVLDWPPDLFALVNRALDASEAYRLVVSPPPHVAFPGVGAHQPAAAAAEWWASLDADAPPPRSLTRWWDVVRRSMDVGIDTLASGDAWPATEALLTLHAIADEACAGLGTSASVAPGPGCRFRARAREHFAEAGSLSRLSTGALRVIPRCRVSAQGMSIHSLARHVCVRGPQVDVEWHRMPSRPGGVRAPDAHANGVLLPWPMRVRSRDFRRAPYRLANMDPTEFGFFTFDPAEPLDVRRVAQVLRTAIDEAGTVDFVFMPESAITPADIAPLEQVLGEHGVWCFVAGVREMPASDDALGANWVHVGLRHEMVWRHAAQHKHHRWCLDGRQIAQYHLGGALSPSIRWWEAASIPRRSLQVIDQGAVTIVPLVCEDLARLEPVADLVRSIGPSLVVTLLLDGPQLASRWTARYASVLADDPGSTVCTLTSYGMVRRCRPPGCEPSNVVALWKDASGQLTEIALEDGADAVLVSTYVTNAGSVTADGRRHEGTTSTLLLAGVQSLRAPTAGPAEVEVTPGRVEPLGRLDEREVSKATSWAEAAAEAVAGAPDAIEQLMADATDERWRAALGLRPPSRLFRAAIDALRDALAGRATIEGLADAARVLRCSDSPAAVMAGTVVDVALEQRLVAEVRAGRLPPEVLGVA